MDSRRQKSHCAWLRKFPNACDQFPEEVLETLSEEKQKEIRDNECVCPHNTYYHNADVFANRDAVTETLERIFRLANSAEAGILSESDMDPMTVTELLTARGELDRQHREKTESDRQQAQMEAEMNKVKSNTRLPGTMGRRS